MKKKKWTKGKLSAIAAGVFITIAVPFAVMNNSGSDPKTSPSPMPQIEIPAQVQNAVQHREGVLFDYKGVNHPERLMNTIKQQSEDKVLFVVFDDPNCPYCRALKQSFNEIKTPDHSGDTLSDLEYDVLLVNVKDYYVTVAALGAAKEGVPETYVFHNGKSLGYFGGAIPTPGLVKLMDDIKTQTSKTPIQKESLQTPIP